jgi:hypothetical protein
MPMIYGDIIVCILEAKGQKSHEDRIPLVIPFRAAHTYIRLRSCGECCFRALGVLSPDQEVCHHPDHSGGMVRPVP